MAEKCLQFSDWSPVACPKGYNTLRRDRYVTGRGNPSRARKWALTLGNELSKETLGLTEQEVLLGRSAWVESRRVREPRRTALPCGSDLRFYGDGISFWVASDQSFWLRAFPGGAHVAQPRWMPVRRILGGGRTRSVCFWPLLISSSRWWLVSSMFLTRAFCPKTTHADGYYGARPGWAASVSVLPLKGCVLSRKFSSSPFFTGTPS